MVQISSRPVQTAAIRTQPVRALRFAGNDALTSLVTHQRQKKSLRNVRATHYLRPEPPPRLTGGGKPNEGIIFKALLLAANVFIGCG